jgi:aspartate-semialdehyde dehydrogenase
LSGVAIAVVGATGAVGQEMLRVLEERRMPIRELRALASARSVGQKVRFAGGDVPVGPVESAAFQGVDFALFSAGASVSREFAPAAVREGAIVVDNSSAFRMDTGVPLVVPECNPEALAAHRGLIANPNCSTILLVLTLAPLHRAARLRRVVVATYQAASGAGQRAVEELRRSTRVRLEGGSPQSVVLPHSLAFNLFARIDVFGPDGYTREEDKLLHETRKILGLPDLAVEATCVRVPVERCHSEAVSVELEEAITPAAARAVLDAAEGVEVLDDPGEDRHPQPIHAAGRDPVLVGRVRESRAFTNGIAYWLVGDQLRKGAALNAVQIIESIQG